MDEEDLLRKARSRNKRISDATATNMHVALEIFYPIFIMTRAFRELNSNVSGPEALGITPRQRCSLV